MKTGMLAFTALVILLALAACGVAPGVPAPVSTPTEPSPRPQPVLPTPTNTPSFQNTEASSLPDQEEIKALLARLVDDEQRATAMVIGMISADPPRRWVVGYGRLSQTDPRVPDGDTVFEIASISKLYTGTLLGIAVQKGEVKLTDPIAKYLPEGVTAPKFSGLPITLKDLATHSSGLPGMPANFNPRDRRNPYADYTLDQMYDFLSTYELPRQPGLDYEYSNYGMSLLGNLMVRVAGQPDYETLLVKRICDPLGMDSTRIRFTPSMQSRLAAPHNSILAPDHNWDLTAFAGAGGIRSTANDMLKFLAANMEITPSDLIPAMKLANTISWPSDTMASRETKLGLAWNITTMNGTVTHWHNGQTGGYHTFLGWDPDRKIGIVILANSPVYNEDVGFHLLNASNEMTPHAPRPPLPTPVAVDPQILATYAGTYQLDETTRFIIRSKGARLLLSQNNIPGVEVELFARSKTDFYRRDANVEITFVTNPSGSVEKMLYLEDGTNYIALKLKNQP